MFFALNRREFLAAACATPAIAAVKPTPIVDTHVHLFDPKRVPYAFNAPYRPKAQTVEDYDKFVQFVGIAHAVIVHPEPYQDDHRYLEYCFAHEPSQNFFKGTCLFDPTSPYTPTRMEALCKKNPSRIVALRIHEVRKKGTPPLYVEKDKPRPPIKDRDMRSPAMAATWAQAQALGLAIQMHFVPYFAPEIATLAAKFPAMPVILDHLGRPNDGTAAEFEGVLKLAKNRNVYMKFSNIKAMSKAPYPYLDAEPTVQRIYNTFGPDRMIWGDLGYTREEFDQQSKLFDLMFDFANANDRAKIRGLNAISLFKW